MLRRLLRWGVFLIGVALLVTGIRLSWYRLAAVPIRTWTIPGLLEKDAMVGVNSTNRTGEFGIFLDSTTTFAKGPGEVLYDLRNPPSAEPVKVAGRGVTFAPAGDRVLYFDFGNQYRIWEAGNPMPTAKMTPKQDLATGGGMTLINALSPAGDVLAMTSVSTDGIYGVSLFSAKDGKKLRDLHGHKQYLHQCDFNIDGTKVLTASKDGTLILWDVISGRRSPRSLRTWW